MFDLSGKFSEFKDKISGKKRADQNYIQGAASLMRRIADNSRINITEGRTDDKELLAAYCYGALIGYDRDHGKKPELVHGAMHHMLARKFHFPESHALQLIKQIQSAREHDGSERLWQMIRRGEHYYELLREGREHYAAGEAEAAFCLSLFEAKDDVYIAPPGDERIREFEEAHGVKFPEEYIRFLKEYNGAVPVRGGIDCCGVTYYVERFLPLLDKAGVAEMRLTEGRETVEKLLQLEMDAVIRQYADRITDDLDLTEMY